MITFDFYTSPIWRFEVETMMPKIEPVVTVSFQGNLEMMGKEKRSESMSLDREGAYAAATLTLIDGLAPEEQATTLHHLAELYKSQELPKP